MKITERQIAAPRMRVDRDTGSAYYSDGAHLREFEVVSDSGHTYTVAETANDETCGDEILRTWECDCPAAKFHPEKLCKHIQAVVDHVEGE